MGDVHIHKLFTFLIESSPTAMIRDYIAPSSVQSFHIMILLDDNVATVT